MGQVVTRKFFCVKCRRERWPGDCEHGRVVSGLGGLSLLQQQLVFYDVCRLCRKTPRGCNCPAEARRAKAGSATNATALHVLALSGCSCGHHVTAYLANDVKGTITCGTCCSSVTTGNALTFSTGEVVVSGDRIDNTGRSVISLLKVKEAIAFGLTDKAERELVYDTRMPGWVSNDHFMAYVGEDACSALLREHKNVESTYIFDHFKDWEAAGLGARLFYETVKCGTKDNPVDMVAWGVGYEWSVAEPNDTLSIVAPAYSNLLSGGAIGTSIHRSPNQASNGFSMLVAWNGRKISAVAMPRRETIIR